MNLSLFVDLHFRHPSDAAKNCFLAIPPFHEKNTKGPIWLKQIAFATLIDVA